MRKVVKPPVVLGPPKLLGHVVALLLSAVLLGVIYPSTGWWWLAYVALVPGALLARHAESLWRLVWVSVPVFWVWWVVMLWWLVPVTLGGTMAASLILSLFTTLGWVLIRRLTLHGRLSLTVAVPVVWVLVELLRTRMPFGGFAWFLLGHSQGPWLPEHSASLIQTASLFGELTVTGVVAVINGFIADVMIHSFRTPKPDEERPPFRKRFLGRLAGVTVVGLVVWVAAGTPPFAGETRDPTDSPGVVVSVVQTNEPQDNRQSPSLEDRIRYWHELLIETERAIEASTSLDPDRTHEHVIIWPESVAPVGIDPQTLAWADEKGFTSFGQIEGQIRDLAAVHGVHLIVGAPAYERWVEVELEDGRVGWLPDGPRNSVFHYGPDGRQQSKRYDKMHRVPFGEYLPIVDYIPWLKNMVVKYLTPYDVDYTIQPGDDVVVFDIDENGPVWLRLVTPICFEDTVARLVREMVNTARESENAHLFGLVNMTNDGWFAIPGQGYQRLQMSAFRCVENNVPMAKAANTGISAFIAADGRILELVEADGRHKGFAGSATRWWRSGEYERTLYSYVGENPLVIVCVLLALFGSGLLNRPMSRKAGNSSDPDKMQE
ncbi:apolipoprotein N-acyltransferase [Mucisphaera calidilacus]|uniref:Apolipoprotein N-acyltransferase n=1 Tax=Mucisphaera calidilacus TaxID=2527982 RepID=A0A518BZD6_9BACT|nr:apolipoprotein N-acyltransferase [Mucisphaera calidilacus]QDU72325.1 Apolipoprotein N-acyltransferase [Mucisphaera calidilacus]